MRHLFIALGCLLLISPGWGAEIKLADGSVIQGTILSLVDGEDLTVDTAHMDEVVIEWEAVVSIEGSQIVEVELFDGKQLMGTVRHDGKSLQVAAVDHLTIDANDVFSITEVNETFQERISAYSDLGSNFVRGNNTVSQLSLGLGLGYTAPDWEAYIRASTIVNEQNGADSTRRFTLNGNYMQDIGDNWLALGLYQFESDEQQGLSGRSLVGGGLGRRLWNNRMHRLSAYGGFVLNVEDFDDLSRSESTEAFLELRYRLRWLFDTDISYAVFPSLDNDNRLRTQFDGSVSMDLFSDLDFKVTVYDRYDSDPPAGNSTNDTGVTMGLHWDY